MKHNNFTPLRLLLALLVAIAHYRWLTTGENYSTYPFPFIYGGFAVQSFFVISGYLIAGSYANDPNLKRFYIRRFFRIYPLYIAVIIFQTFIIISCLQGHISEHANELARYFIFNAFFANFLQKDVAGILHRLNDPDLNASLWTLKIEIGFYLILPAIWIAFRRSGIKVLVILFVASAIYFEVFSRIGYYVLAKQLPGQLQFFALGIGAYAWRDRIKLNILTGISSTLFLSALITLLIINNLKLPLLFPLLITALVVISARFTPVIPLKTDISYGVYLLHAPVTQLLLFTCYRSIAPNIYLTLALVIVMALVAEYFIEAPFIAFGHRLTHKRATTPVHPYGS